MVQLIFTSDYELFGNGQGNVEACMIRPANLLMDILEEYKYRMTFFVDVCEIWAFEKEKKSGNIASNVDPAMSIKKQIIEMVQRGHDVQLHLHPQWLDYKFENNSWQLNYDYWRLPKVEDHPLWNIEGLIKKGKNYLEDLIKPIKKDYKCQAFRAGAYCIQPEEKVLLALKNNGFTFDSSVLPNMKLDNGLSYFDFTSSPVKPYWSIGETLFDEIKEGSITELPIFTMPVSRKKYLNFVQKRTEMKACDCKGEPAAKTIGFGSKSILGKVKKLIQKQHLIFDYCGASFEEMKHILDQALSLHGSSRIYVPIVLIGHPKNFNNEHNLRSFLGHLSSAENIYLNNGNRLTDIEVISN